MEQKSKFDKVMGAWDILVIAFGAMIGWGWVINSGDWITTAGFAGSMIAMGPTGSFVCTWMIILGYVATRPLFLVWALRS